MGKLFGSFAIVYMAVVVAGVAGWIMNLIDVVHLAVANSPVTTMFAVRILGIFAFPLGALLGWF